MFLVFDWWLDVIWLKSHWNATNCIDFNIVIRILNTPVSAKMAQGQRKWHVVYCYYYYYYYYLTFNGAVNDKNFVKMTFPYVHVVRNSTYINICSYRYIHSLSIRVSTSAMCVTITVHITMPHRKCLMFPSSLPRDPSHLSRVLFIREATDVI